MLPFAFAQSAASLNSELFLEISTRPYLYKLSQTLHKQIKTIRQIPDSEFSSWRDKGFKWVWFMGVWQVGELGPQHDRTDPGLKNSYNAVLPGWSVDDVIGSPYCIVSYTINKELGNEDDIRWLRSKLHEYGMKLMLDYVPNHSAMDAPEITTKKNFYIRSPSGQPLDERKFMSNGIAYGCGEWCDPWTDVAQFNYFDDEFRESRFTLLERLAGLCDGVRCDMAHLVINDKFAKYWSAELAAWGYTRPSEEFWVVAIRRSKAINPDFHFMAECYSDTLNTLMGFGFDSVYDKECIDLLVSHNVEGLKNRVRSFNEPEKYRLAHFTENHDEPRTMSTYWNWSPAADAAAGALLTLPGIRFVFQDQWLGLAKKLDVHLRRALDEPSRPDVVEFYKKLFSILNKECMKTGTFMQMEVTGDQASTIMAWKYSKNDEHILVCVNFDENTKSGNIVIDDVPRTGSEIPFTDLITGEVYQRNPDELSTTGLVVVLQHYQVQVFQY